jgi:DNA-binding CsgD family transcriptional regulator
MNLSPAERKVAMGRLADLPIKDIAFRLKVSPKTIEFHWGHIKKKLGIQTPLGLLYRVINTL